MRPVRTALFPGTFDPFTNGHLDLTRRGARMFDRVVVAVAPSPAKGTLFPLAERVAMIRDVVRSMPTVEVIAFDDLLVECARRVGATAIIRGLRAVSDFEYEFQMALMNRRLAPGIEIVFMMPSQDFSYLNSTLVKEVARFGGRVRGLVPRRVEDRLLAALRPAVPAGAPSRTVIPRRAAPRRARPTKGGRR